MRELEPELRARTQARHPIPSRDGPALALEPTPAQLGLGALERRRGSSQAHELLGASPVAQQLHDRLDVFDLAARADAMAMLAVDMITLESTLAQRDAGQELSLVDASEAQARRAGDCSRERADLASLDREAPLGAEQDRAGPRLDLTRPTAWRARDHVRAAELDAIDTNPRGDLRLATLVEQELGDAPLVALVDPL